MTWKVAYNFGNGKFAKLILMIKAKRDKFKTSGKIPYKTLIMKELLHTQFYTFDFFLFL